MGLIFLPPHTIFWSCHIFHSELVHESGKRFFLLPINFLAGYPKPAMTVGLSSFGIAKSLLSFSSLIPVNRPEPTPSFHAVSCISVAPFLHQSNENCTLDLSELLLRICICYPASACTILCHLLEIVFIIH